jgi:hypothetical protein
MHYWDILTDEEKSHISIGIGAIARRRSCRKRFGKPPTLAVLNEFFKTKEYAIQCVVCRRIIDKLALDNTNLR